MNHNKRVIPPTIVRTGAFLSLCLVLATVFIITDNLPDETMAGKRYWFPFALTVATLCIFPVACRHCRISITATDTVTAFFIIYFITYAFLIPPVSAGRFRFGVALFIAWFCLRVYTAVYGRRELVFFLLSAALVEALWGIGQYAGLFPAYHRLFGISGSFFNPGPYAGFLSVIFPVALASALKNQPETACIFTRKRSCMTPEGWKNGITGLLASAACTAIVPALALTLSRTAWISTAAGSILVGWIYYRPGIKIKKFAIRRRGLATLVGIGLIAGTALAATSLYRLKKESAQGRLLLWKISARTLLTNGIKGMGCGGFAAAYGKEQAAYFSAGKGSDAEKKVAGCPEYAFNEFLQTGIELGAGGLILFLTLFFIAIRSCIGRKDGIAAALLSFLIFAAASYPLSVLPTAILAVFLLATAPSAGSISISSRMLNIPLALCGFFLLGWLPFLCRQYRAEKEWDRMRGRYRTGYFDRIGDYHGLYPLLKDNPVFLFEYGRSLSRNGLYDAGTRILQEGAQLSCDPMFYNIIGKNYQDCYATGRAADCYKYAAALVPGRAYPLYLLTRLYRENGDSASALHYGRQLLDLKTKVDSPEIKEMKQEIRKWIKELPPRPELPASGSFPGVSMQAY